MNGTLVCVCVCVCVAIFRKEFNFSTNFRCHPKGPPFLMKTAEIEMKILVAEHAEYDTINHFAAFCQHFALFRLKRLKNTPTSEMV